MGRRTQLSQGLHCRLLAQGGEVAARIAVGQVGQIVEVPVAERHVIVPDEVLDEVSAPICSGQRHINPLHEPSPRGLVQVLRAVRGA